MYLPVTPGAVSRDEARRGALGCVLRRRTKRRLPVPPARPAARPATFPLARVCCRLETRRRRCLVLCSVSSVFVVVWFRSSLLCGGRSVQCCIVMRRVVVARSSDGIVSCRSGCAATTPFCVVLVRLSWPCLAVGRFHAVYGATPARLCVYRSRGL